MKILILGSTRYVHTKIAERKKELEEQGHIVMIPAFDTMKGSELDIVRYNKKLIQKADKIEMYWDRRSAGALVDLGMVIALDKPFEIAYLEPKTFENLMLQYEVSCYGI